MRLPLLASTVLLLTLGGCSSDGNDPEGNDARSGIVGRWALERYTLDDGSTKLVPDSADARLEIRSDDTLAVEYVCGGFDLSYTFDDGILTTMNPAPPGPQCDEVEDGADAMERNQLLSDALLNTQTMAAVSDDDLLSVTTGTNEVLVFERARDASGAPSPSLGTGLVGPTWIWDGYRASPDAEVEPVDAGTEAVYSLLFTMTDYGGTASCAGYSGDYRADVSGSATNGGSLMMDSPDVDAVVCEEVADLPSFLRSLTMAASYVIEDDRLTIFLADGAALLFVAGNDSSLDAN